ncbi:MAG: hypothetical protein AB1744_02915 [Candidatus Zixiibacteriota bacterium]
MWFTGISAPAMVGSMPKPKTMCGRKMVSLPTETWQRVEDYRFECRYRTESDAIRALIANGLAASPWHELASRLTDVLKEIAADGRLQAAEQAEVNRLWREMRQSLGRSEDEARNALPFPERD